MKRLEWLGEIVAVASFSALAAAAISMMGVQECEVVAKGGLQANEFCWSPLPRNIARGTAVQQRYLR
ncbi:MAG: hypothetical protein ACOYB1_01670 [Limnohabitans sp.]